MRAAGVTRVNGDVVIDDRLFTPHKYPDGLVSPIWVNENLVDIEVTPGSAAGQATTIDWRPRTASYTVETQATTVDAETTALEVTEPTPGHLVVTGQIAPATRPRWCREVADPVGVRPHGLHRGAAARRRHCDRTRDRPQPRPRCCRPRAATRPPTGSVSTCRRLSPRTSS